jgi:hypothetical protein
MHWVLLRISNIKGIVMSLVTKHNHMSLLVRTRAEIHFQQATYCIYSFCVNVEKLYLQNRQITRHWHQEHKHSLKEGIREKSKLAQHAY